MKLILIGVVAAAVTFAAVNAVWASSPAGPRTVELSIHNSAFDRATITVPYGEEVRFVVRNTDPIDHELILGPADVQLRHELGTEKLHGARPGEVSVPAGTTRSTTYSVTTREPVQFACHLPGHFAYGMRGVVRVVPTS
jgi:uncharacterized cupredoxin-like copper-binding protein